MRRTYIDANLLITAFQGCGPSWRRAMEVLDDPDRMLVVSDYLRLEVLPKPTFHKRQEEVEFMRAVLEGAEEIATSTDLTNRAVGFASDYDLAPIDALHISAAVTADVDEFVTIEKDTKPMCRVRDVTVISLYSSK